MSGDVLTVLRHARLLLTKRVVRDARGDIAIHPFDEAKHFAVDEVAVPNFFALAKALDRVSRDQKACLIRGAPLPGIDRSHARRLLHPAKDGHPATFCEMPRRWLMVDFDNVRAPSFVHHDGGELAGIFLRRKLPPQFHGSSFWWSFTSSAGLRDDGRLRMRLGFMLDRAVGQEEADRWLATSPVDLALNRPVQPCFLARPIFEGVRDSIQERSGTYIDFGDLVQVPDLVPAPKPARAAPRPWASHHASLRGDPLRILEDAAAKVATAPEAGMNAYGRSGRRLALFCAGLRCSSLVAGGQLAVNDVLTVLSAAGRQAGLRDDHEIIPHVENGLRQGGVHV